MDSCARAAQPKRHCSRTIRRARRSTANLALAFWLLTGCAAATRPEPADPVPPPIVLSLAGRSFTPQSPVTHQATIGVQPNWYHLNEVRAFMQRLGGGRSWVPVVWCNIERQPGIWDWTALDGIVHEARSLDLTLQLKIRVGACWLTERGPRFHTGYTTESEMPRDLNSYAAFVQTVVTRYSGLGVQTYAVENEPNTRYQWGGTLGQLIRLTEVAVSAVRGADPRASVADWGLSTGVYGDAVAQRLLSFHQGREAVASYNRYYRTATPPLSAASVSHLEAILGSGQDRRNLVYLRADERLLDEGVFDIRQLHFYESTAVLPSVIAYLRGTTPARVPIEVWELGRHIRQGAKGIRAVVRSVCLLVAAGARQVNWLPLAAPTSGQEPNFALLEASGTPRPAGLAYRRLARLVARASSFRPLTLAGLSGLVMTEPGHTTLVVWSDGRATERLRLPARTQVAAFGGSVDREGRVLEVRGVPLLIEVSQSLATLQGAGTSTP